MIPDDVVDEVRERADLLEIVGEVVPLKRSGKDYKGQCPFHDDRTPSFYVVPTKGFYKCFGCGESGDAFTFVMKRHGMDFVEAVRYVGQRSGVEVREESSPGAEEDPHRHLREANAFARNFFRERLADGGAGGGAREYLEGRGIDDATAERFELGYAPPGWRNLADAARAHGIEPGILETLGLVITSERAPEPYDRFRDRIIFPIEDHRGRIVAFGGRVVGKGEGDAPKYVNSPESPIYTKGEVLYGLVRSRHAIRREGFALLVEGYMDAVALAATGFEPVVAALGTSLTDDQASLLGRYTRRVLLLFDSDPAGLRAAFRAGDTLLLRGIHPSVVTFAPGDDPDDLVRREGPEALQKYLDQAVDVLDRKLQILEERGYFESIDGTRRAVDRLLPTLRATRDPALRDIYLAKVSERTGVRADTLEAEMVEGTAGREGSAARPPPGSGGRTGRARAPGGPARGSRHRVPGTELLREMGPERQLLVLLVAAREWIDRAAERLGPEDFHRAEHREIFRALVEDPELEAPPEGMHPEAARRFRALLQVDPGELQSAGRVFEDSINEIRARSLDRRKSELDDRIRTSDDGGEVRALLREKERLRRELAQLRPTARPHGRRADPTGGRIDHEQQ